MRDEPLVTLPPALLVHGAGGDGRWVMGVDGGATKTLAAVLDLQERSLHLGHGASSNADAVGARAATESLLRATDEALDRAGIGPERLDGAVLAVAGTDTEAIAAHVRAVRPGGWVVVNDVVGAWAVATGARPGVGAISGTGSNVFGVGRVGAETRSWRAGGWGHILGDQGSGYWLATRSLRAALADRDRSGPRTALSEAAVEFFGARSIEALATLVYAKPLSKGEIAAFAIETARVAHGGDEVACALYERAARELGAQIRAVIEQTGLVGKFPVGLIGSAFKAGAVFVAPLAAQIEQAAPQASVSVVQTAPVGGCLLLAARLAGRDGELGGEQLRRLLDDLLAREGAFRE
ncbi:MAG TPA: BadF/BadG/BcrA/BcrD ATPase family protein [Methylomirabilota bacterium]|nr:BadF/BadG/BcrA/BcrD ATPase family protein [Methylomirabilota bacterium]